MLLSRFLRSSLIILTILLANASGVLAQPVSSEQRRLLESGVPYFDIEASTTTCQAQVISNTTQQAGPIYVLGDSLTVGMRDTGDLSEKLAAKGYTPKKINAIGGKDLSWGLQQVQADRAIIDQSQMVLVGLGTNEAGVVGRGTNPAAGKEPLKREMQALVDAINPPETPTKKTIYWTNFYVKGTVASQYGTTNLDTAMPLLNEALQEVATANGITIIPWATFADAPSLVEAEFRRSGFGIHPSDYKAMATFVVNNLASGGQAPQQCGASLLPGVNDAEKIWNFFIGKGVKPFQVAGMLGNMQRESGVRAVCLQSASGCKPVGSAEAVKIAVPGSSLGWGVVQWTPGTKMIIPSFEAKNPYQTIDTIDFQANFLWEQLTGAGLGGKELSEKAAGDHLFATKTVEDAAHSFATKFERCAHCQTGTNDMNERIEFAKAWLAKFGGGIQ